MNRLNQNGSALDIYNDSLNASALSGRANTSGEKNENSKSFTDAGKFLGFTSNFDDNWFSVRYNYDSHLYPNYTAKLDLVKTAPFFTNATGKEKVAVSQKKDTETVSLVWAKELAKGLAAGAELGINRSNTEMKQLYNTDAEKATILATGATPFADSQSFDVSKPYGSLLLGAIKDIDASSKISVSHKLTQMKYNFENLSDVYSTEAMPQETGLSYLYNVNKDLEVALNVKKFWAVSYVNNIHADGEASEEARKKHEYTSYGFATDYKLAKDWTLQGYANFIRNYLKNEIGGDESTMDYGYNLSQLGGNAQYDLAGLGLQGKFLLGTYWTKLVSEDKDKGYIFDITNAYFAYTYNF